MTKDEWKQIEHFSPNENWGDPERMSLELLRRLDALREFSGHPVIIHCGYATSGHSGNSQHYLGKAADLHIVGVSLVNQYLLAERFNFGGLGLYPEWKNPGLHCDVRYKGIEEPQSRWIKTRGQYRILTEDTFRAIFSVQELQQSGGFFPTCR